MKCPLISSASGAHGCLYEECMFYDKDKDCLIKEALLCYINRENERINNIKLFKREYYNKQIEDQQMRLNNEMLQQIIRKEIEK